MFGTNDVVYVPEDSQLVFDDVYHWRRIKIDARRLGLRLRPAGFEELAGRVRSAMELVQRSPRYAASAEQIVRDAEVALRDLALMAGGGTEAMAGTLHDAVRNERALWWVRLSDAAAESFHEEDYERSLSPVANATPHFTYGTVTFGKLDDLEVSLAEKDEEDLLPFSIDVPDEGLTRFTIPPDQPLPLVREFCGLHGSSAHGRTVNISAQGQLAPAHQFCTPLGRVGASLFSTLYMHYQIEPQAEVMGVLRPDRLMPAAALLEKSHFQLAAEGPTFRIYERNGDVIHLYSGLEGKESEGAGTIPPFLLVACAGGQYDPMNRGALFEGIKDAMR